MARDNRTMRQSRRTYRRQRCTYTLPDGFRCRAWPEQDSDRCKLHAEPATSGPATPPPEPPGGPPSPPPLPTSTSVTPPC